MYFTVLFNILDNNLISKDRPIQWSAELFSFLAQQYPSLSATSLLDWKKSLDYLVRVSTINEAKLHFIHTGLLKAIVDLQLKHSGSLLPESCINIAANLATEPACHEQLFALNLLDLIASLIISHENQRTACRCGMKAISLLCNVPGAPKDEKSQKHLIKAAIQVLSEYNHTGQSKVFLEACNAINSLAAISEYNRGVINGCGGILLLLEALLLFRNSSEVVHQVVVTLLSLSELQDNLEMISETTLQGGDDAGDEEITGTELLQIIQSQYSGQGVIDQSCADLLVKLAHLPVDDN